MKLKALVAALAVAAILPVAALADEASPSDKANGARSCQALKASLGTLFASTYGTNADKSNAFGKCVSKWTQAEHQNRLAATAACTAEQADANFAASHGGKTFAQFYGSGKKGANAMNQCIQSKRAAESAADKQKVDERGPHVQGGAEGDGRRAVQGQVRQQRERVRQVRLEARCGEELAARLGGALAAPRPLLLSRGAPRARR